MSTLYDPPKEPVAVVVDTGVFVACGRQQNNKYVALERFTQQNGLTLHIPERVYAELGGAPARSTPGQTPIDSAIESGWVTVADPPEYTNSIVASVMDEVSRRIASASNRSEDSVEKTDTALAAVSVRLLDDRQARFVYLVTTDVDAGEAVVSAVEAHGFDGQVAFIDGFELIEDIAKQ